MTEHDLMLISQAESVDHTQWFDINELIPMADTDEAREKLRRIKITKHHREEYYARSL